MARSPIRGDSPADWERSTMFFFPCFLFVEEGNLFRALSISEALRLWAKLLDQIRQPCYVKKEARNGFARRLTYCLTIFLEICSISLFLIRFPAKFVGLIREKSQMGILIQMVHRFSFFRFFVLFTGKLVNVSESSLQESGSRESGSRESSLRESSLRARCGGVANNFKRRAACAQTDVKRASTLSEIFCKDSFNVSNYSSSWLNFIRIMSLSYYLWARACVCEEVIVLFCFKQAGRDPGLTRKVFQSSRELWKFSRANGSRLYLPFPAWV